MVAHIEELLDEYWKWVREETQIREIGNEIEVTTPYLDRHNDCMQIFVTPIEDGVRLSDDGNVLEDLKRSGIDIDAPRKNSILQSTLNGFGVKRIGDRLTVDATASDFSFKKHNLLQSMLAINDLHYLEGASKDSRFNMDVGRWLDSQEICYTKDVDLPGRTGFNHRFDYVIPKNSDQPKRVVRTLNQPNAVNTKALVFAVLDTRNDSEEQSSAFAILNDLEKKTTQKSLDALKNYEIEPVCWTDRESIVKKLSA